MKTLKDDLLQGFVNMPHDLMQAGWPLKIDLYRYTPMKNVLELCWKQGEVIELEPFLELCLNPTVLILAEEESLNSLRAGQSALDDLDECDEAT